MKSKLVKVICRDCSGTKKHRKCGGRGEYQGEALFCPPTYRCSDCNETGDCPDCHGKGYFFLEEERCDDSWVKIICDDCNGSGKHKTCEGDGWYWEESWFSGKKRCQECNRTGNCPECLGVGYYFLEGESQENLGPPFKAKC